MKYIKATVLLGVEEEAMKDWSEHADVTRYLEYRGLHNPAAFIYLHNHEAYPKITEDEFRNMHKCIDEAGGI